MTSGVSVSGSAGLRWSCRAVAFGFALLPTVVAAQWRVGGSIEPGYRLDEFKWNIGSSLAGNTTPNILSELSWTDLHIAEIEAGGHLEHVSGLRLRADASWGTILAGDNQDSDYLGNDRTLEFSRSNNDASQGSVDRLGVSVGWSVPMSGKLRFDGSGRTYLVPLLGYETRNIRLRMQDGVQTVASIFTPPLGPFEDLDSSYEAKWQGPWVGLEFVDEQPRDLHGFLRVEYHRPEYDAKANWNLRSDFSHPVSFRHHAEGDGVVVRLGLQTPERKGLSWRMQLGYEYWKTNHGIDRTFFSDGTQSEIRLNEVKWESWSLHYGLQYHF